MTIKKAAKHNEIKPFRAFNHEKNSPNREHPFGFW